MFLELQFCCSVSELVCLLRVRTSNNALVCFNGPRDLNGNYSH